MKNVYYHGTYAEAGRDIILNGFKDAEKIWNCSGWNSLYVWDKDKIDECLLEPYWSGLIAAAKTNSKERNIFIFRIEVDEDFDVSVNDYSCENMDCAREFNIDELNKLISLGKINISYQIMEDSYFPEFRFAYLIGLKEEYLDFSYEDLKVLDISKRIFSEYAYEELYQNSNPCSEINEDSWINLGFLDVPCAA